MRYAAVISAMMVLSVCAVAGADMPSNEDSDVDVRHTLAMALQQRYPEVTSWALQPIERAGQPLPLPHGKPTSVSVLHVGARSAVRATWPEAGTVTQTRTLWYQVSGTRNVVVAAREILAGTDISTADLGEAERDIVALGCTPLATIDALRGMRAQRTVPAGRPVCMEGTEARPAVARGDTVLVHYASHRVDITTKATAQQDAAIGQTLRLINPLSHEPFSAVVTAMREAVIHE